VHLKVAKVELQLGEIESSIFTGSSKATKSLHLYEA